MIQAKTESKSFISTDYIVVSVVTTIFRLALNVLFTLLPLYILDHGHSKTEAGLMITVYTISALVFRPFVGRLIDTQGRRKMLVIGTIVYTASIFPMAFTSSLPVLYVMQALCGIGFSIHSVALTTMITDVVPENRLTEGLGFYGLIATLVQAFGSMIALAMMNSLGFANGFLLVGISCLLALFLSVFIRYEFKRKSERLAEDPKREDIQYGQHRWWEKLIEKNPLKPALFTCLFMVIMAATMLYLVPYAQEATIASIGWFFILRAAGTAISRVLVGWLSKKIRNKAIISASILGIFVSTVGIYLFTDIIPLTVAAFVNGISFGFVTTILNVDAVRNTPPQRRAAANATYYLAMDVGMSIGSALWGSLADATGLRNIFAEAALLALLVFPVFLVVNRVKKHELTVVNTMLR